MRGALVLAALLPVLGACSSDGQQAAASTGGQQSAPVAAPGAPVAAPSINFAEPASPTDSHGNPAPGTHAFCTAALRAAGNGTALRRLTGRDPKHGVDWGIWSDADSLATDWENASLFAKDLNALQENLTADTKSLRDDCATNGQ